MGEVVDIGQAKRGWATGPAVCLSCDHKWIATAPAGRCILECPECHLYKAVRQGLYEPRPEDLVWTCQTPECEGQLFWAMEHALMCIRCGACRAAPAPPDICPE